MATSELTPLPMSPEHATLLAEIGSLVEILREQLLHQEGEKFVALVDRVRTLSEPAAASPGGPGPRSFRRFLLGSILTRAPELFVALALAFRLATFPRRLNRLSAL